MFSHSFDSNASLPPCAATRVSASITARPGPEGSHDSERTDFRMLSANEVFLQTKARSGQDSRQPTATLCLSQATIAKDLGQSTADHRR